MNVARRFKGRKVDISIDRSAIYRDVFYGNDVKPSNKLLKSLSGFLRYGKKAGRVLVLPFAWLYRALVAFGSPSDPNKGLEETMPILNVPYYRPSIKKMGMQPMVAMAAVSIPVSVGSAIRKRRNGGTATAGGGALPGLHKKRKPITIAINPEERAARQVAVENQVPITTDASRRRRGWKWFFRLSGVAALSGMLAVGGYINWYETEGRFSIVVINDGETSIQVKTEDATVGDVLAAQGLELTARDLINTGTAAPVSDGLVVNITRAREITIHKGQDSHTIKMAEGTVADALSYAGVSYRPQDEVSPGVDNAIQEVSEIRIVTVDSDVRIETKAIPFNTQYQDNSSLLKGATSVVRQGKEGTITTRYHQVIKDGVVVEETVLSTETTARPVDQIVQRGTKILDASGDYQKGTVAPTGDRVKGTIKVDKITAYTHTGGNTSTGRKPAVGLCAVNPKQIPYGTKLYIPGYGYAIAADTGGFVNWGGTMIDVFMNSESECRSWGVKRNRTVYIIK
ncbi:G5 domain-containing protein [Eubacteriales bacterium OttesenSCG-928-M02]|nr:G5 domain-containing protein [Eubacteriales bacterium OttesenSCG-928-M02]